MNTHCEARMQHPYHNESWNISSSASPNNVVITEVISNRDQGYEDHIKTSHSMAYKYSHNVQWH